MIKRATRHTTGSVIYDKRRGTWNFFWYEGGKRRSKLIGTKQQYPTKAAAWRAIAALRPMPEPPPTGGTMNSLILRYENERMPDRHSTNRVYRSFLKRHIIPRWGDTPVELVQPRDVELWLRSLKLAAKTKSHLRSLLHTLVEFAMWSGELGVQRNPMDLVMVKGVSKRLKRPRVLTVEEFAALLAELREPFATVAVVSLCLGLRISETLALKWGDIDWMAATISILRSIVERHVDVPKTEDSAETMDASAELLSRLQLWRQASEFRAEGDWVFASPVKIGRLPYSYTGVWRELQRAAVAAGVGKLGTHSFRHSYRAWLGISGTPLEVQRKAMRHTDIRTTLRYGDVVDDRVGQALKKVSELAFANSTQAARAPS